MTTQPNGPEPDPRTVADLAGYLAGPDQLALDEHDPDALDDRGARLRAELDRLDLAKSAARAEALTAVQLAADAHRGAARRLDEAVAEARGYGATWQQVADAAGLVKSAAWERWANR